MPEIRFISPLRVKERERERELNEMSSTIGAEDRAHGSNV